MTPRKAPPDEAKPERFSGFPDASGGFFRGLAANNERSYFLAHKDTYEREWVAPMEALLREVRAKLDRSYPDVELGEPKLFRIQRDVRFSKDKTPYKTHIGARIPVIRAGGIIEVPMALYLQLGESPFVAAGLYGASPEALTRLRRAIIDETEGKALDTILRKLRRAHEDLRISAIDETKRVPRGFDEAHPRADLLRLKGLAVSFSLVAGADPKAHAKLLGSAALVDAIAAVGRDAAPLVRWLTFATA